MTCTTIHYHPQQGQRVRGKLTPDVCGVHVCDGLPSLTIVGRSDRFTGSVLDHVRSELARELPSRRVTVYLRESCGANAATVAEWIVETLGHAGTLTTTITVWERECPADDFDTENGSGMPDDAEAYEVATVELAAGDSVADALAGVGCGQWDGGEVGYDPDGSSMAPDGTITERWAVVRATTGEPIRCPDCAEPIELHGSGWWSHVGLPGDCWRVSMDGPNAPNADRAAYGSHAVSVGTPDYGMTVREGYYDEDAVDTVTNVLHHLHVNGGLTPDDCLSVLDRATRHFMAEAFGE